ncbi:MAG TPA: hypothetical protein VH372_04465 [Actinospica sp.]|jgi:hypothetical protein|nr:hypothetical protein [Actinospica sp.]
MSPRTVVNPAPAPSADTITPDLAAVLHDARPHPQLGAPAPQPPSTARLGRAAAAIAAGLALRPEADPDLAGLNASYLLPAGTRARVHRTGPSGVLLLAPSDAQRAVAAAGPGIYVVVESSG